VAVPVRRWDGPSQRHRAQNGTRHSGGCITGPASFARHGSSVPRNIGAEFLLALQEGYLYPVMFVEMYFATGPVRVCTWNQDLLLNGNVFEATGNLLQLSTIEDGSEVHARGINVSLSGFDPTLLPLVLNDFQVGLPVTIYFGTFDSQTSQQVSNSCIAWQGRTDEPTITVGADTATISIACESILMDLNTPIPWRYTNQDQQLFYPGDLGFQWVNSIQSIVIYWNSAATSNGNP
jgi:hypothetical protein